MIIDVTKITELEKNKIEKGLIDYNYIQNNYKFNTEEFQDLFYSFYLKARWSIMTKKENLIPYFEVMQNTNKDSTILNVINSLQTKMESKTLEFSIATKLLHTINDNNPIYDSKVREFLKTQGIEFLWNQSSTKTLNEREKINKDYITLCDWYKEYLKTKEAKSVIKWFNKNFKKYKHISNIKKIDSIIVAIN